MSETNNGSDNTNKQISETRPGSRKDWCSRDVRDLSNSFRKAESISSTGIDVTGKQQARFHTQILSLRRSDLWKSPGSPSGCLCDSSRAGINPGEDSFSSSQKMGSCPKWACKDRGPSAALGTNSEGPELHQCPHNFSVSYRLTCIHSTCPTTGSWLFTVGAIKISEGEWISEGWKVWICLRVL